MAYVIVASYLDCYCANPYYNEILNKKIYDTLEECREALCEEAEERGWKRIKTFYVENLPYMCGTTTIDLMMKRVGTIVPVHDSARDPMSDEEWDSIDLEKAYDMSDVASYYVYEISDEDRRQFGDKELVKMLSNGEPSDLPDEVYYDDYCYQFDSKIDPKPHLNCCKMSRDAEEMKQMRKYGFIYAPLLKKCIKKANVRHERYRAKKLIDYELDSYEK